MKFPDPTVRDADAARRCRFGLLPSRRFRKRRSPAGGNPGFHPVSGDEGQSMVETALVLPILLGFVIGLIVIFLAFYTHEYVSELAREGTRYAAVHGSSCMTSAGASCTATASQVNSYVAGIGLPNLGGGAMTASNVSTTYPDGDEVPAHRVMVTVTYIFPYKIPFVMSKSLSMSSTSVMTIVQ